MANKAITARCIILKFNAEQFANSLSRDALMDISARANGRDRVPMCRSEWIVGGA